MTDVSVNVEIPTDPLQVNVEVIETEPNLEVDVTLEQTEALVIDVLPTGPRGPQGLPGQDGQDGAPGAPGEPGAPGDGASSFTHLQDFAQTVWPIQHDLGYYPNVTTVDTLKREIVGDVEYIDINNLEITFTASTAGWAYLS